MKKFVTMAMAAAMAASMGTTAMAAETKTATASNAGVLVNGAEIAPEAYTIDGYTFFKLRDVAAAVAGTEAGFDVTWDAEAKKIALTTGVSYEAVAEAGKKAEGKKKATLSTAPVLVDGEEAVLTAYTIDGYTYFKLRDLGTAAGFEVTWDNEAKQIGINAAVLEETTEEAVEEEIAEEEAVEEVVEETAEDMILEYNLEMGVELASNGETFEHEVVVSCPAERNEETPYSIVFTNCVFEKGLKIVSDGATEVTIGEGCVFAEGTGVVVEEVTEGNHLNMTLEDYFVRVHTEVDGLAVTTDDIVTVVADGETSFTLNGEVFSPDVFEEDGPIDGYATVYYYEDGEVNFYTEAWGPEDAEEVIEEEAVEEDAVEEEIAEEA